MVQHTSTPAIAQSLAMAVIASSNAPLVLLGGDLTVVSASASFCTAFGLNAAVVPGLKIHELGDGEWNVPQLRSLLQATLSGQAEVSAYEMDLKRKGQDARRLVLNAQKLEYGDEANIRLLLAITDVTKARISEKLKDDLVREKAMLLQEVQHRVANSLQIIASILLQSARKVMSQESRGHLESAHNRVMSIASVQQQLAASSLGDVDMRPYLKQLCQSLGASMIRDHSEMSIEVVADESSVSADASVSLGLIVTELVINSLKHAFPNYRGGKITVDFTSNGGHWTLAIEDNGIGMPKDPSMARPGLGTTIVEALAKQLGAGVVASNANPGTRVAISQQDNLEAAQSAI
ncbi:MAG: Signal transduction histidine kinase [Hyphomicrobiales bacterium]|nr:Signal transduction histidine kinase [Hyphomicrobiales bacterium]